jgi:acetyl-CoA carboxylase, biotin carboxylase subunit
VISKVLIANRGEIALRVARACRELGLRTVAVHSTADADSAVVSQADEAVCIGPPPGKHSYGNPAAIIEAARITGADAVHPGYGFLSEDPDFVQICEQNGLTFIGPRPEVMAVLSDKASARAIMREAGLPLLPGSLHTPSSVTEAHQLANEIGYPVIVKAAAGGGGRGMAVVRDSDDFPAAYRETRAAAQAVFGDGRVYVERYLEPARHVEVQLLCDEHGNGVHFGTRDCSVQRRQQKLIEEAPAPGISPGALAEMAESALRGALAAGFTGAGTAEFVVGEDESYYFMEVNNRIQVEHPVTEMVTGVDLVQEQLRIAGGEPLRWRQEDIELRGVAIECRINAEDPDREFAPTPGALDEFALPGGPFTRVESAAQPGHRIPPHYDPLLAKVVVWAPSREAARQRMARALEECDVAGPGVKTTIPFLERVLADPRFRHGRHSTALVDQVLATGPAEPGPQEGGNR